MPERPWRIEWIGNANKNALEDVAAGVFDESIKPDRRDRYLENPANWMVLAILDGQVVGQCMCVVHDHPDKQTELFLDEIGTGDDFRRRGIAQSLMEAVFARADENGIEEIWLGTEPDNLPARALYEKSCGESEPAIIYYLDW